MRLFAEARRACADGWYDGGLRRDSANVRETADYIAPSLVHCRIQFQELSEEGLTDWNDNTAGKGASPQKRKDQAQMPEQVDTIR